MFFSPPYVDGPPVISLACIALGTPPCPAKDICPPAGSIGLGGRLGRGGTTIPGIASIGGKIGCSTVNGRWPISGGRSWNCGLSGRLNCLSFATNGNSGAPCISSPDTYLFGPGASIGSVLPGTAPSPAITAPPPPCNIAPSTSPCDRSWPRLICS